MNRSAGPGERRDGDRREEERLDVGFGFGLAVVAAALGLLAVLDRIGAPPELVQLLVLALMLVGFLAVAGLRRTTRPEYFYGAGGFWPPRFAGLAAAVLAAGLFFCLLPITSGDARLSTLTLGCVLGLIAAYFGTGALLRRSGAVSLSDLIAARFPTLSRFAIIAFVAAICAFLVACSGYDLALRGLMAATGLGRAGAALVLFVVLGFLVVTGGLSTVLWAAVETMIIVVVGLMLPLVLDVVNGQPLALPAIGDPVLWASAETSLAATLGGAPNDHASTFSLIATFAVGLASLAPLLGPTIAGSRAAEFARTGFIAFAWLGLLALFVCAAAAAATLSLDTAVVGHPPAQVPAAVLAANARGNVTLCGGKAADSAALQRDCAKQPGYAGRLRLADIRVMPAFLIDGGTKLRHLGPVIAGLADSLLVGLGVALAAAGFQSFVTSIGHDAIAAERRRHISTSLRLAFSRGLAILAIGAVGILLTFKAADTGTMLTLALFISAAVIAPVMALLMWPRANSLDASVTLLVTILLVVGLVLSRGAVIVPTDLAPSILLAGVSGFMAGVFSSLLRGEAAENEIAVASRPRIPGPFVRDQRREGRQVPEPVAPHEPPRDPGDGA